MLPPPKSKGDREKEEAERILANAFPRPPLLHVRKLQTSEEIKRNMDSKPNAENSVSDPSIELTLHSELLPASARQRGMLSKFLPASRRPSENQISNQNEVSRALSSQQQSALPPLPLDVAIWPRQFSICVSCTRIIQPLCPRSSFDRHTVTFG